MSGTSFLDLLRTQYLNTLNSIDPSQARWKILVVDEYTHKMLLSLFSQFEILDTGIQQIDIITNQRTAQPRLPAIYLLMPTSQNVELILRDYNPAPPPQPSGRSSKKDKNPPAGQLVEKPKYAAAHLHFVDGIDDGLVNKLTSGLPDQYLAALTELYVNFHALEPRTFSLQTPRTFNTLYAPPGRNPQDAVEKWQTEITWMSKVLVNVLATLGEYPLIRYYNPPSNFHAPLGPASATGEHIGKALAMRVQEEIDKYARDNSDFPPEPNPPRPRGVLFITDRSMDLFAPFLHEFTYQAMCNDLLDVVDGHTYRYSFRNSEGEMEEKESELSNDDNVWNEVKHMHMKDAMDKLIKDFKAYAGEQGKGQGSASLNDMKDMLASLPQLREAKEKLSLHLTMAEKCMGLFETKKLPLSASVEQCCATGVTPEGKSPKTLVEEMVPLLDDRSVSSTDKLRIIATYIMYRDGVPEGDKKRLYQHARLALHEMDAIDNLAYLGVNVSKDSGKKRKQLFKQREEDDAYDISRYQPTVKYMLEEHFAGRLDQAVFPYVKDAPVVAAQKGSLAANPAGGGASLRSLRADWATKGRKVQNEPRQRIIVFVAGGATYSEVRAVYKVSEATNKDVFLGSTSIITPEQFVADLSNLDRGGSAVALKHDAPKPSKSSSRAPPAAVRSPEFQQNDMDRRFPTPSPTPPLPQQQQYRQDPPPKSSSRNPQPQQQQYQQPPPQQQQYRQDPPRDQYRQEPSRDQYRQEPPRDQYRQEPPRDQYREDPRQQQQPQYQQQQRPASQVSSGSYTPSHASADPVQQEKNGKLKKKLFSGKLGF